MLVKLFKVVKVLDHWPQGQSYFNTCSTLGLCKIKGLNLPISPLRKHKSTNTIWGSVLKFNPRLDSSLIFCWVKQHVIILWSFYRADIETLYKYNAWFKIDAVCILFLIDKKYPKLKTTKWFNLNTNFNQENMLEIVWKIFIETHLELVELVDAVLALSISWSNKKSICSK
jgi:hypothetical protein